MKIIAVRGDSGSGKTATIVALIGELRRRGYSVVAAKDVHQPGFSVDTPGKDSARLALATGEAAVVRSENETAFIYRKRMRAEEIAARVEADFLILEGFRDLGCPSIACGKDVEGLPRQVDSQTIAVSGVVADAIGEYNGLPAISARADVGRLADLVGG